ncbi:MAG: hypothetical protein ABH808_00150 [Candidatus Kuenenbacteria bacterium]
MNKFKNPKFLLFLVLILLLVVNFTPLSARTVKMLKNVTDDIFQIVGSLVVEKDVTIKGNLDITGDINVPSLVRNNCYWTNWGCGVMTCNESFFLAGIDFNDTKSEGCWGVGNDYDEPQRRLYCCKL